MPTAMPLPCPFPRVLRVSSASRAADGQLAVGVAVERRVYGCGGVGLRLLDCSGGGPKRVGESRRAVRVYLGRLRRMHARGVLSGEEYAREEGRVERLLERCADRGGDEMRAELECMRLRDASGADRDVR